MAAQARPESTVGLRLWRGGARGARAGRAGRAGQQRLHGGFGVEEVVEVEGLEDAKKFGVRGQLVGVFELLPI